MISRGPVAQTTLPKVLIANWAVWPAANFIAFRFVPADMRILYANCLGVSGPAVSTISHSVFAGLSLRAARRFAVPHPSLHPIVGISIGISWVFVSVVE